MKIERIIGLSVFTDDGKMLSVKEFINTPFPDYHIEMVDGKYKAIPVGDVSECASGVCPVK